MSSDADSEAAPGSTSRARLVKISAVVVALVVFFALTRQLGGYVPALQGWVEGLGALGPLVFIAAYVAGVLAFLPGALLTLTGGALFDLVEGTIYVFTAATIGSSLAFLVARYLARGLIEERLRDHPRFKALDSAVGDQGLKIVFLLRLSPAFPFNFMNYALGVTRVSFRDYLIASIGMLPGTLLYVYYGKVAGDAAAFAAGEVDQGTAHYVVLALGLVATIAVTAIVTRLAKAALAETTSGAASGEEVASAATSVSAIELPPDDVHNRALLANVHPEDWVNPEPSGRYNLVVIGGGTAGLVAAAGAAGVGAKVALIERALLGGDCLNSGCVPSKSLLRSAHAIGDLRAAAQVGVNVASDAVEVDFAAVMERLREIRSRISKNDSARRFRDELGVDVFIGDGRFKDRNQIEVAGKVLQFKNAVIATGARPFVPPIRGLDEAGYYTNETIFSLTELPKRLAIIGGGPIGCELAQAFACLGSRVSLIEMESQFLQREDPDAAEILRAALKRDGVEIALDTQVEEVETVGAEKHLRLSRQGTETRIEVDAILVGAGRIPNVEDLGLEAAGVQHDRRGVLVDDTLRTHNKSIFASGDVCMSTRFTHAADFASRAVIQNALFFGRKKLSALTIPWCTYTRPEIAHVGMYERDAIAAGRQIDTYMRPFSEVDRAITEGEEEGFVKIHTEKGKDKIIGATIVAKHAGEMISEISVAMAGGVGLSRLASVIHPYPTQAEAIRQLGDAYNRTKLTPTVAKIFRWFLAWRR